MLMFIKVGDVAKLENLELPAVDGHYSLNSFLVSADKDMEIQWKNLESQQLVSFPLEEFDEHVKYLIPCTSVRFVKIHP